MKKIILATVALVPAFAFASITDNLYVQGNVGVSNIETTGSILKIDDSTPSFSVAAGKKVGDVRYAVDYTYFGKLEHQVADNVSKTSLEAKTHSVGLSAYYDFKTQSAFKPYVGGRLAVNNVKSSASTTVGTVSNSSSESETVVGYGASLGTAYQLSPKVALDASVEANKLGNLVGGGSLVQYGAKAGVRYNF